MTSVIRSVHAEENPGDAGHRPLSNDGQRAVVHVAQTLLSVRTRETEAHDSIPRGWRTDRSVCPTKALPHFEGDFELTSFGFFTAGRRISCLTVGRTMRSMG